MPICLGCGRVLRDDEIHCPQCEPEAAAAAARIKPEGEDGPRLIPVEKPASSPIIRRTPLRKPVTRKGKVGAGAFAVVAVGMLVFSATHSRLGSSPPPAAQAAVATNRSPAPEQPSADAQSSPEATSSATSAPGPAGSMSEAGPGPAGSSQPALPQRAPTQQLNLPRGQQTYAGQPQSRAGSPGYTAVPQGLLAPGSPEVEAPSAGKVVKVEEQEEPVRVRRPHNQDEVVRYCPFHLEAGTEIRLSLGAQPGPITFSGEKAQAGGAVLAGGVTCRDWTLRGVGGGKLRLSVQQSGAAGRLWVEQPFEIVKSSEVVGTFENTAEYQQLVQ